jgi:uncharacterized protein (TIGR03435 family)
MICLLATAGAASGATPAFEAVSIKASPPPGSSFVVGVTGGPGTKDPGRWNAQNLTLPDLIQVTYHLKGYQYSGPPWLNEARFDIVAKTPEGATRDDLDQMLQNMLVERFGLKFHREERKAEGYEMVIAKGGPKFGTAAPTEPPETGSGTRRSALPGPPAMAADGFPSLQPGRYGYARRGDKVRWQVVGQTTAAFASQLASRVGKPVWDATRLDGKYDFSLYWRIDATGAAPPAADGIGAPSDLIGPSIFTTLQEQLGLRLVPKTGLIEFLVVDHVERTPTAN